MTNYVWSAADSANWSENSAWKPGGVPGADDGATIGVSGAAYFVTVDGAAAAGSLSVSSADATVLIGADDSLALGAAAVSVISAGSLIVSGGSIAMASGAVLEFTAGASLTLGDDGVISGGSIAANAGSTLNFNSTQTFDDEVIALGPGTGGDAAILIVDPQAAGLTLTLGAGVTIKQTGDANFFGSVSSDTIVNEGVIDASAANGTLTIEIVAFENLGAIDVSNGDTVDIGGAFLNESGGTLTGGTYVVEAGSSVTLADDNIATLDANVELKGAGSIFASLESTLTTIGEAGQLTLADRRDFTVSTAAGAIENAGVIDLEDATFTAKSLNADSGSMLEGYGEVDAIFSGAGSVEADGGTLVFNYFLDVFSGSVGGANPGDMVEIATAARFDSGATLSAPVFEIGSTATVTVDEDLNFDEVLKLLPGGTLSISADDTLTLAGDDSFAGAISGKGALDIVGGDDLFASGATLSAALTMQSGGALEIDENLTYAGSLAQFDGTIAIAADDTLSLSDSDSLASVSGAGALDFTGGTTTYDGTTLTVAALSIGAGAAVYFGDSLSYGGALTMTGGAIFVDADETLTLSGDETISGTIGGAGTLAVSSGTLAFDSNALTVGALSQSGGTIAIERVSYQEDLDYAGDLTQTGGAIAISSGLTLTLTAPATLAGTIAGSGALALSGDTVGFGAATLTIANLIVTDDAVVTFDDSLSYAGSLDEAAGTIYIGADDALTLSGSSTLSGSLAGDELIIAGGSTTMTASASISVGAITIDKGADFVATGPSGSDESLASAVANSGTLVVESSASDGSGADLTIFGKLMQASTGIVELLRGATLTLDQVVSGGTIAFGGGADEVLEIDDAASLAATTGALGAEIAGFGVGDTIDFGGLDIASLTASAASGVTTVTLALSGAQSLKFELAGTYAATNFKTTGDAVTLAPNFTTPVLAGAGNTATFVAGSSAGVAVDPLLTISPIGDEITGATVTISQGLNAGDLLGYADMDGIAGVYDAADGVLTLSGTANVVSYEAALESVTYASTSNDPTRAGADAARTITWSVASQTHQSGPTTSTVDITVPAPTLTVSSLYGSYTQGGAAYTPNDVTYVTYESSADLTGAKVAITGGFFTGDTLGFVSQFGIAGAYDALTGVLTLSGSASVADYQTALESVTFSSTSANPTDYGADESRAFSWQVTGGGKTSTAATSTIGVIGVDQAPTLSGGGNSVQAFAGGAAVAVDPGLTVADADNLTLASATVSISSGFAAGDALNFGALPEGLTAVYDPTKGVLTLTGSATVSAYQSILRSVTFSTSGVTLDARTISFTVDDGTKASAPASSTLTLAPSPPAFTGVGTSAIATFAQGSAPVALDATLGLVADGAADLTSAKVWISAGFVAGDTLNLSGADGVTASYSARTGVLTLTGVATVATYQSLLDQITFRNPALSFSASARTISWQVSNSAATASSARNSLVATTSVAVPAITSVQWASASGGAWNTASKWSPALVPNSNGITATLGASSGAPTYVVTLASGAAARVGQLQITDANATLTIGGGLSLTLAGSASASQGTIQLAQSSGKFGDLILGAGATLSNDGTLETKGAGAFGASANEIAGGDVVNQGLIEAMTGGLELIGTDIDYRSGGALAGAGDIEALYSATAAGWVELDNATIDGGELVQGLKGDSLSGYGFYTASGSKTNAIEAATLDGDMFVDEKSELTLEGAVAINGLLQLDPRGLAVLAIEGATTLTGDAAGEIVLGGAATGALGENQIEAAGSSAELTNEITILAKGGAEAMAIGGSALTLINQGTIEAASGSALTIDAGAGATVNSGLLEEAGGTLNVDNALNGTGRIDIDGGHVLLEGAVGSGQQVDFTAGAFGMLKLGHAEDFEGTIEGLAFKSAASFDSIDLVDFSYSSKIKIAVTGTGAAGTTTDVTLTDGSLSATLDLYNATANEYGLFATDYLVTKDSTSSTAGVLFHVA